MRINYCIIASILFSLALVSPGETAARDIYTDLVDQMQYAIEEDDLSALKELIHPDSFGRPPATDDSALTLYLRLARQIVRGKSWSLDHDVLSPEDVPVRDPHPGINAYLKGRAMRVVPDTPRHFLRLRVVSRQGDRTLDLLPVSIHDQRPVFLFPSEKFQLDDDMIDSWIERVERIKADQSLAGVKPTPVRFLHEVNPPPRGFLDHYEDGCATVEYSIDENGYVSRPVVTKSYPQSVYGRSALDEMEKWRFLPSDPGIRYSQKFNYFFVRKSYDADPHIRQNCEVTEEDIAFVRDVWNDRIEQARRRFKPK